MLLLPFLPPLLDLLLQAILRLNPVRSARLSFVFQFLTGLALVVPALQVLRSETPLRLDLPDLILFSGAFALRPDLLVHAWNAPVLLMMGLSLPLVYYWLRDSYAEAGRSFFISAAIFQIGMIGAFLAESLAFFYVFFEISLIGMYFWIGMHGRDETGRALTRFFLFTLVGSLAMLAAVAYVISLHGTDPGLFALTERIDAIAATSGPGAIQWTLFAFLLAFAVKTPLFPLHGWLRDAYASAPPVARALLSAFMSKLGVYGFLVVAFAYRNQLETIGPFLAVLALIGVVYGGLLCLSERTLLGVLIYSSLTHLNLIALAIFCADYSAGAPGLSSIASAALFQVFNHGLIMAALFALEDRAGADERSRGLLHKNRRLGALLLTALFASISLPGMSNFAGELLILAAAAERSLWYAAGALLGLLFTAMGLIRVFHAAFLGAPSDAASNKATERSPGSADGSDARPDFGVADTAPGLALIALWIVLGLAPMLLLGPMERAFQTFLTGGAG